MRNNKIRWIAQTAVLIALLIAVQYISRPWSQLVTGSLVNFVLAAAALIAGPVSGLVVAMISPVLAKLLGIGPVWQFVPVIMLGNAVLALVYGLLFRKAITLSGTNKYLTFGAAIPLAAVLKAGVIYVGIVKILIPTMTQLKPPQVEKMTQMFSWTQLFTALIGGGIAMLVVPAVLSALRKSRS
ncbi:MAG TPA: ECF transporter S component [Clostridiales bacterium]|nr:ECF transporter S component [Clostridiales bacterium]